MRCVPVVQGRSFALGRGGPAGRGGRAATTDLVHVVDVCATAQPHEYQWSVSNTAFLYMHSTTTYCRVDLFDHMYELVTNALRTRYKLVHMNDHVIFDTRRCERCSAVATISVELRQRCFRVHAFHRIILHATTYMSA
jgi:hypothetical protein